MSAGHLADPCCNGNEGVRLVGMGLRPLPHPGDLLWGSNRLGELWRTLLPSFARDAARSISASVPMNLSPASVGVASSGRISPDHSGDDRG